jgi:hypothetical protein
VAGEKIRQRSSCRAGHQRTYGAAGARKAFGRRRQSCPKPSRRQGLNTGGTGHAVSAIAIRATLLGSGGVFFCALTTLSCCYGGHLVRSRNARRVCSGRSQEGASTDCDLQDN